MILCTRSLPIFTVLFIFAAQTLAAESLEHRLIQLNDEANLDVLDRNFAAQQTRLFEMDKKQSHEMTLDKTGDLHPLQQAAELASPQL